MEQSGQPLEENPISHKNQTKNSNHFCYSVSVLQWLCNADASSHSPPQRLQRFFATLAACLCRGARAVFQFYPESDDQVTFIMSFAMKAGFSGGLVVDYPNSSKKKKYYLVLISGQADSTTTAKPELPAALGVGGAEETVPYERRRERIKTKVKGKRTSVKNKDWIMHKKQLNKARGKEVPSDSKCVSPFFLLCIEYADGSSVGILGGGGNRCFRVRPTCRYYFLLESLCQ
jgi:hypothetical protein